EPRLASGYSDVVVEPYASPSVHFLLPNTQNPLLRRRAFRRAIAHGINRALVLESFQGKKDSEPGELISGPFPRGVAYDSSLEPLPYDPRMMIALATGAQERIGGVGVSTTKPVTLVLAHPPTSVARRACAIIKQHLELDGKGIGVRLHELNPQEKTPPWDLLYVEWFLMDPLTDAHRLLSDKALQWGDSRWIAPALRDLIRAENPQQARQQLRAIHSAVHHDQTVIPLWQLREHYARRKTLEGLGADLGTLYQNVEQWRHGPKIPKF
ncbi:MAG: ABC transporter substrate-binding protein, partial [Planctomycetales bacterium]